jgi:hypothetical protein
LLLPSLRLDQYLVLNSELVAAELLVSVFLVQSSVVLCLQRLFEDSVSFVVSVIN